MTVSELIEKLQDMDQNMDVKFSNFGHVNYVEQETERDPYCGDFDKQVVVIS